MMKPGHDYIGVGVGAILFNEAGQIFMSQRGPRANNERGCWEFPGGRVEFGETLQDALLREFQEEYGIDIEVGVLLCVDNHILPDEGQHWVSPTFLARHLAGTPQILEPEKCIAIGWFNWDNLPQPLSVISQMNISAYQRQYTA